MQGKLTPREQEIFDLMLEGTSPNEIANKLNVSYSTVNHYRSKLYRKLEVRNIQELLTKYSKDGKTKSTVETESASSANTDEKKTEFLISKTRNNKTKKFLILLIAVFSIIICVLILIIRNLYKSSAPESSNTSTEIINKNESGFIIYDNGLPDGFYLNLYSRQSPINFFSTPAAQDAIQDTTHGAVQSAAQSEFVIHWNNIDKWHYFNISFTGRDLSYHVQNGYFLEFKAKTEDPVQFDVKFHHFENNFIWHIGFHRFEQYRLLSNGEWHTIRLPLEHMNLWGGFNAETGEWCEPDGKSNYWANIRELEFVAIQDDGSITEIYLDDIKVTK